jgi:hypothetical protein
MKVYTKNTERRIAEMTKMWHWMTDTFGPPEAHNDNLKRWTYGKDSRGFLSSNTIDGTFDIEWFDFRDEADATLFTLKWSK